MSKLALLISFMGAIWEKKKKRKICSRISPWMLGWCGDSWQQRCTLTLRLGIKAHAAYCYEWGFFNVFFLFLRERQTEHELGRVREREDTESEASSRLWVVSTEPDIGLEPTDHEIMTWAEVRCLTNWATQVPRYEWVFHKCLYRRFPKLGGTEEWVILIQCLNEDRGKCVCVCVCMCKHACTCKCACMWMCAWDCMNAWQKGCVWVCVCMYVY